jgi:hypothetical protein
MPATNPRMMLLIDFPLVLGTTGSLAAFYMMAESAQGRSRLGALRQLPALLALGAGLAPHLSKAVWEGLHSMAGEFIRTPKKGTLQGRYRAAADLPMTEIALCLVSAASTMAAIETGHWFATPFAMLFTSGYGYVAFFVASEQLARKSAQSARAPTETSMAHAPGLAVSGESSPPPASEASGSPEAGLAA